jgi:hypothetical protein
MPPAIVIARAATRDDTDGAVLTLARACARDPFTDWLVRRDAGRAAALRACFAIAFAGTASARRLDRAMDRKPGDAV